MGGDNQSPPSDVAPGGGTYPVDALGNAYNPAWGSGGSPILANISTAMKNWQTPNPTNPQGGQLAGVNTGVPQSQGPPLIPQSGGGLDIAALIRLLGGG